MSQSLASPPSNSRPLSQKIIVAVTVVIIGHIGALWGLNQIKAPELKPVEKKPIKVKLVKQVKIKEEPPPPPPPQVKKKEQPKVKEVKIVKNATPPPAKEVKKVVTAKAVTPPKHVNQMVNPKPAIPSNIVSSTSSNSNVTKPVNTAPVTQPKETIPATQPTNTSSTSTSSSSTSTTKHVNIGSGGVQWALSPSLKLQPSDIEKTCTVEVGIKANEKGKVTSAVIRSTTCEARLTSRIRTAVQNARFKPYLENGVAYQITANQSFTLNPPVKKN